MKTEMVFQKITNLRPNGIAKVRNRDTQKRNSIWAGCMPKDMVFQRTTYLRSSGIAKRKNRVTQLRDYAKELDLEFETMEIMNRSEVTELKEGEVDSEISEVYITGNRKAI